MIVRFMFEHAKEDPERSEYLTKYYIVILNYYSGCVYVRDSDMCRFFLFYNI